MFPAGLKQGKTDTKTDICKCRDGRYVTIKQQWLDLYQTEHTLKQISANAEVDIIYNHEGSIHLENMTHICKSQLYLNLERYWTP